MVPRNSLKMDAQGFLQGQQRANPEWFDRAMVGSLGNLRRFGIEKMLKSWRARAALMIRSQNEHVLCLPSSHRSSGEKLAIG
jgi:hypothetical protein